jgi:hypothetical protein
VAEALYRPYQTGPPGAYPGRKGGKNIMTLYELTGQESGIIVRENAVIVTNWLHSCPSGGLPLLSPWGDDLIEWPSEIVVKSEYYVGDIRDVLPGTIIPGDEGTIKAEGMDIVYDNNGDIPALWGYQVNTCMLGATINRDRAGNLIPTAGKVYELEDGTLIIVPDGWC